MVLDWIDDDLTLAELKPSARMSGLCTGILFKFILNFRTNHAG